MQSFGHLLLRYLQAAHLFGFITDLLKNVKRKNTKIVKSKTRIWLFVFLFVSFLFPINPTATFQFLNSEDSECFKTFT